MDSKMHKKELVESKTYTIIPGATASHVHSFKFNFHRDVKAIKISFHSKLNYSEAANFPFLRMKSNIPGLEDLGIVSANSAAGANMPLYFVWSQTKRFNGQYNITLLLPDLSQPTFANAASSALTMVCQFIS